MEQAMLKLSMKKTTVLMSMIVSAYLLLNTLVYFSESSPEAFSQKDLDPSMPIHSVIGTAKETILLTPNLEHAFRSNNLYIRKSASASN